MQKRRKTKSDVPDKKIFTPPKKRSRTKEDMLSACRKGCLEVQDEKTMEIEIARWECCTEKGQYHPFH